MATLNGDILHEIIGLIDQRDRQTILLNLALVSRSCFHITRPLLFADVRWPHSEKYNKGGLIFFPRKLWDHFKTLHLDWPTEWSEGDSPLWGSKNGEKYTPRHLDKLEAALPFMSGLHTFQITCPFDPPLSLFRVLQECASLKDLRITDTPVWDAIGDSNAPVLFTAERITFSPVGEGARVGEGPYNKKFHDFRSYASAEYRKRYLDLIMYRTWSMKCSPPGWSFLLCCAVETLTYLQLSGEYLSLDDFNTPGLSFPVLGTLILTGPCPSVAPGSTMTLPEVLCRMPMLRDLRVLISSSSPGYPLSLVPICSKASLAVYGQLTSLAISNQAQDIAAVLRYANGLERFAINATIYLPHLPIALRWHEVDSVLDNIQGGGGGERLRELRVMSEDEFTLAFVQRLGDVCPSLEVVELELCGYRFYGDDLHLLDVFSQTFAGYRYLRELRVGLRFPVCDHGLKPHCKPCISDFRHRCAVHFARQLPQLRRIGLEYRTYRRKYEDRWMDFDIIRTFDGSLEVHELPVSWYPFPEVWKYVPMIE